MTERLTFIVALDDLRQTKFIATPLEQLETGEVLLKFDRFALTANNITYAELNNPSRAKPSCCAFECPLTGEMGGIHERRFLADLRRSRVALRRPLPAQAACTEICVTPPAQRNRDALI